MARQPVGRDQHHVEAQGEAGELRVPRQEMLEGTGNAAALARRDGLARRDEIFIATREEWLQRVVELWRPFFSRLGFELLTRVGISAAARD